MEVVNEMGLGDNYEEIIKILYEVNAVKVAPSEGPYFDYSATTESGEHFKGATYVDCRNIVSHDGLKERIAQHMKRNIGGSGFNVVLGSTTAGMSPAENLSRVLGEDAHYFYVRTDNKEYGLGKRIEGDKSLLYKSDKLNVVIAEDLINSGRSTKIVYNAIKKFAEQENLTISNVVITAIASYGNKKFSEWVEKESIRVEPLVYLSDVFREGPSLGYITEAQASSALDFLTDSTAWREARGLPTK